MNAPKRIQRKRAAGWRMPVGAVYVGRPTKWGNPWAAGDRLIDGGIETAAGAVEKYRQWMIGQIRAGVLDLDLLVGRDLACWCALDAPCHADTLLDLAGAYARRLGLRVPGRLSP